jgi:hypothetical protein
VLSIAAKTGTPATLQRGANDASSSSNHIQQL